MGTIELEQTQREGPYELGKLLRRFELHGGNAIDFFWGRLMNFTDFGVWSLELVYVHSVDRNRLNK